MRDNLLWSTTELPALLDALARKAGIPRRDVATVNTPGPATETQVRLDAKPLVQRDYRGLMHEDRSIHAG